MARGLTVHFSDYDRTPLEFVARSATESGFDESRYRMRLLDWRNLPGERFPVILGADVIYEARLVPRVANVLDAMLAPGGIGLIASPYRVAAVGFPNAVASLGLTCRAERANARAEDGRPDRGDDLSRHAMRGRTRGPRGCAVAGVASAQPRSRLDRSVPMIPRTESAPISSSRAPRSSSSVSAAVGS